MRGSQYFFLTIAFLLSLTLFGLGILFLLLPHAPYFHQQLITFLQDRMDLFTWIGLGVFALGCLLFSVFYAMNRPGYLLIEMGPYPIFIDNEAIATLVKKELEQLYPGKRLHCEVILRKKDKVEILTDLPAIEVEDLEERLNQIEKKLTSMLSTTCGYQREFIFNVSFRSH